MKDNDGMDGWNKLTLREKIFLFPFALLFLLLVLLGPGLLIRLIVH